MKNGARGVGKTTKTIDKGIQILFEKGQIIIPSFDELPYNRKDTMRGKDTDLLVIDPDYSLSPNVQRELFSKILNRLRNEHGNQFDIIKNSKIVIRK